VPGKQQLIHGPRLDRIRIGTEDIDPDLTANCRDPHGPFGPSAHPRVDESARL
jgi:hypothetical protein